MERLSEYRIMWVLVFFDLPTETQRDRKLYAEFRKKLRNDGFNMFQFSVYMRHCPSRENAEAHIRRIKSILPPHGKICIMCITDKQFGMMEVFIGKKPADKETGPRQLELF